MKKVISILMFVVIALPLFLVAKPVSADIAMPTTANFYFKQDGKEYNQPVDFTIKCLGYSVYPGDPDFGKDATDQGRTTSEVYSFSGSCPKYGCALDMNIYLNYIHINSCSLYGKTAGQDFTIENYGNYPVNSCGGPAQDSSKQLCTATFNIPAASVVAPTNNQNQQKNIQNPVVPDYSNGIKNTPPLNPVPDGGKPGIMKITTYDDLFFYAFLFTIIIETLVLFGLLRLAFKKKSVNIKNKDILFTGIIASAVTIPYLWFVLPDFLNGVPYIIVGELGVVLVESLIIAWILKLKWPFALLLSFICNLVSFLLGLLILRNF